MNHLKSFGRIKFISLLAVVIVVATVLISSVALANRNSAELSPQVMLPLIIRKSGIAGPDHAQKFFGVQMYG